MPLTISRILRQNPVPCEKCGELVKFSVHHRRWGTTKDGRNWVFDNNNCEEHIVSPDSETEGSVYLGFVLPGHGRKEFRRKNWKALPTAFTQNKINSPQWLEKEVSMVIARALTFYDNQRLKGLPTNYAQLKDIVDGKTPLEKSRAPSKMVMEAFCHILEKEYPYKITESNSTRGTKIAALGWVYRFLLFGPYKEVLRYAKKDIDFADLDDNVLDLFVNFLKENKPWKRGRLKKSEGGDLRLLESEIDRGIVLKNVMNNEPRKGEWNNGNGRVLTMIHVGWFFKMAKKYRFTKRDFGEYSTTSINVKPIEKRALPKESLQKIIMYTPSTAKEVYWKRIFMILIELCFSYVDARRFDSSCLTPIGNGRAIVRLKRQKTGANVAFVLNPSQLNKIVDIGKTSPYKRNGCGLLKLPPYNTAYVQFIYLGKKTIGRALTTYVTRHTGVNQMESHGVDPTERLLKAGHSQGEYVRSYQALDDNTIHNIHVSEEITKKVRQLVMGEGVDESKILELLSSLENKK